MGNWATGSFANWAINSESTTISWDTIEKLVKQENERWGWKIEPRPAIRNEKTREDIMGPHTD